MIGVVVATLALGGGCYSASVVQQQYVAPVYTPQVYYFVGAPIRAQAAMQQDADWQEFQQFKAWKQGQGQPETAQATQQPTDGIVTQLCRNCHKEPTQANNFYKLTGEEMVSAETVTKAIRAVAFGEMPKNRKLTEQEKNAWVAELLSLEQGVEE